MLVLLQPLYAPQPAQSFPLNEACAKYKLSINLPPDLDGALDNLVFPNQNLELAIHQPHSSERQTNLLYKPPNEYTE